MKFFIILLFTVLLIEIGLRSCITDAVLFNRTKKEKKTYIRQQPIWRKVFYVFIIKETYAKRHLVLFYILRCFNCLFLVVSILGITSVIQYNRYLLIITVVFYSFVIAYTVLLPSGKTKRIDFSKIKKP